MVHDGVFEPVFQGLVLDDNNGWRMEVAILEELAQGGNEGFGTVPGVEMEVVDMVHIQWSHGIS